VSKLGLADAEPGAEWIRQGPAVISIFWADLVSPPILHRHVARL